MNRGTNDKCFICGNKDHFVKDCNYEDTYVCNYCDKEFSDEVKCERHKILANINICFRCGRDSHYINDCYAKTTINGGTIDYSTDGQ